MIQPQAADTPLHLIGTLAQYITCADGKTNGARNDGRFFINLIFSRTSARGRNYEN